MRSISGFSVDIDIYVYSWKWRAIEETRYGRRTHSNEINAFQAWPTYGTGNEVFTHILWKNVGLLATLKKWMKKEILNN